MDSIRDLDAETPESFTFRLGGFQYSMRYPTTEEVVEIAKEVDEEKVSEKIYGLISPSEGAPAIKEALEKGQVNKVRAFLEMVRKEVSL